MSHNRNTNEQILKPWPISFVEITASFIVYLIFSYIVPIITEVKSGEIWPLYLTELFADLCAKFHLLNYIPI